jgi:putative transposase
MFFESGHIYHIYNQGNNHHKIFFQRENYLFFLKKIHEHILPYCDVIAWCLMPNHFHLMVYVREVEIEIPAAVSVARESQTFTLSEGLTRPVKKRSLNDSIGIMLRSYTRAIHKQENMSGSLFRETTKAENITKASTITPAFFDSSSGTFINVQHLYLQYPQRCFEYIHNNPVSARLVKKPEDWEFSSYLDYSGKRDGNLIHRKRAEEFGLELESNY